MAYPSQLMARCTSCDGRTQFRVVYTGERVQLAGYGAHHIAIECVVCGFVLPALGESGSGEIRVLDRTQLESKEFPDVPDHIASAAAEAHLCRSAGALRGSVILARAVIEATAKDRGITSGNLMGKIDEMANRQLVREYVKEGAHEIRHFGNDIAHGDFSDVVHEGDVDLALQLMDTVLDEVYQAPARVERARQRRMAADS